jgi:hypothetical protein
MNSRYIRGRREIRNGEGVGNDQREAKDIDACTIVFGMYADNRGLSIAEFIETARW